MLKPLTSFFAVFVFTVVAACSGGSAAGVYELDKAELKKTMLAMVPATEEGKQAKDMMEGMMAGMSGSIELKADGTAAMSIKMPPMVNESTTGTWKLDGSTITMIAKDKDGKDDPKTAKYSAGTITIEQDEGGKKMAMVFRRK